MTDYDNPYIVQCVHCGGSGVCGRAQWRQVIVTSSERGGDNTARAWYQCDRCGTGIEDSMSDFHTIYGYELPNKLRPTIPTCAVCRGSGFVRV